MYKKILIWALIVSLSFEQALLFSSRARAAEENSAEKEKHFVDGVDPVLKHEKTRADFLIKELETAQPGQFPSRTVDIAGLTGQTLEVANYTVQTNDSRALQYLNKVRAFLRLKPKVYTKTVEFKPYELGEYAAPVIIPGDFENEVKVELNSKERYFALGYYTKGEFVARQKFSGYDIVSFARDEEYLTLLDRSGLLIAIDMVTAQRYVLNMEILVTKLTDFHRNLDSSFELMYLKSGIGNLDIDLNPIMPLDISRDSRLLMGALAVVRKSGGKRKIVALIPRIKLGEVVGESQKRIANEIIAVTPPEEAQPILDQLKAEENQAQTEAAQRELKLTEPSLTQLSLVRKLGNEYAALLGARANANLNLKDSEQKFHRTTVAGLQDEYADLFKGAEKLSADKEKQIAEYQAGLTKMKSLRDKVFTLIGGKTQDKVLADEVAALKEQMANEDVSESRNEILKARADADIAKILEKQKAERKALQKTWTPKKMAIVAALTAGVAIAGYEGPAWGIHIYNEISSWEIFDIIRDAEYRSVLWKSILVQESLLPIVNIIGVLSLAVIGKKGWHYSQALALMFLRGCAALVISPLHRIANFMGEDLYMKALQRGVRRPLVKLPGYEEVYPYVTNMPTFSKMLSAEEWKKQRSEEAKNKKSEALGILELRQKTSEKAAMALATIAVAEHAKQDPSFIKLVMEQGPLTVDQIKAFVTTNGFSKQWNRTRYDLQMELLYLDSFTHLSDFQNMNPEEFAEALRVAREVSQRINDAGFVGTKMIQMRQGFNKSFNSTLQYVGGWGVKANQFLKSVQPVEDLSSSQLKQANWDLGLAVFIMASIGAHANLNDPRMLMAQEHAPGWTNPFVMSETFEQWWIYLGTAFANQLISMHENVDPSAFEKYAASEYTRLQGVREKESIPRSAWEQIKDLSDISRSRMGDYPFRKFKTDMDLLWLRMSGYVLFKMVIIGYSVGSAAMRFAYTQLVGYWMISSIWQPIMRGIQMRTSRLNGLESDLADRRARLAQNIRLNEMTEAALNMPDLADLYPSREELPKEIRDFLEQLDAFAKNPNYLQIDYIKESLRSQGPALIEFTRAKPPFATKPNHMFDHGAIISGSIATTITYTWITKYANAVDMTSQFLFAIPIVASLYAGSWFIQKQGDKYIPILKKWWAARRAEKKGKPATEADRAALRETCRVKLSKLLDH